MPASRGQVGSRVLPALAPYAALLRAPGLLPDAARDASAIAGTAEAFVACASSQALDAGLHGRRPGARAQRETGRRPAGSIQIARAAGELATVAALTGFRAARAVRRRVAGAARRHAAGRRRVPLDGLAPHPPDTRLRSLSGCRPRNNPRVSVREGYGFSCTCKRARIAVVIARSRTGAATPARVASTLLWGARQSTL